jgi:hypothetical protein
MTLKSAVQDLQDRTLRAVTGLLGKLAYISTLRGADGSYSHWGLERVHGHDATQRALKDAHHSVVATILRTPLRNLVEDVRTSTLEGSSPSSLLQALRENPAEVLPPGPGAGTEPHLNSVLHSLLRLVKNRR